MDWKTSLERSAKREEETEMMTISLLRVLNRPAGSSGQAPSSEQGY